MIENVDTNENIDWVNILKIPIVISAITKGV